MKYTFSHAGFNKVGKHWTLWHVPSLSKYYFKENTTLWFYWWRFYFVVIKKGSKV